MMHLCISSQTLEATKSLIHCSAISFRISEVLSPFGERGVMLPSTPQALSFWRRLAKAITPCSFLRSSSFAHRTVLSTICCSRCMLAS
eukprot:CAMPEP_0171256502 /NCGR_PEP_ID=MMETSP0790-20130122/53339_1 /TAXON_ID=2925 /ORGANISM="Alexandrium catenella, Strain OF101" /LENGTH=87 /DNA_ID=CAMNT_0011724535 /DNA_START=116 /DNA_END=379 /DNA_ORIENTATION=+